MNIIEFLGSNVTKGIASTLIIGQVGLLFFNISYAAPASKFEKIGTMSATEAKITGNAKGVEWLRNAQVNAVNTNISASGDIAFNGVGLDSAPQNEQTVGNKNLNLNQSNPSMNSRLNGIQMEKTNGDGSKTSVGLNLNDLTPDSASCKNNPELCKKYYSNGQLPTSQQMQGLYNSDENAVTNLSQNYHQSLKDEVNGGSSGMSVQAQVYGILNDVSHYNKPDLSNDPSLKNANSILNNSVSNPFTDCGKTNTLLNSIKQTVHTKDLQKCVDNQLNHCSIIKQPDLSIVSYYGSKAKYGDCGENCTIMYVGDIDKAQNSSAINSMNSGACTPSSTTFSLYATNPDAIIDAEVTAVYGAGAAKATLQSIDSGSPDNILFNINSNGNDHSNETKDLQCEQNRGLFTAVSKSVNNRAKGIRYNGEKISLLDYLKNKKSNHVAQFNIEYAGAMPVIEVQIKYDPKKAARNDMWSGSQDCLNKAIDITNGKLDGVVECRNQLPMTNGYIYGNGTKIPVAYLNSSFGLGGNCTEANVAIVEELKNETMPEGISTSLCSDLKNKGCEYAGQTCRKTYTDKSGMEKCAVYEYTYDCGYDTEVNTPHTAALTSCPNGQTIQCQGYDCMNLIVSNGDSTDNSKKDFNKALGLLNESQQAANDMTCTKKDDGTLDCRFFAGTYQTCDRKKFLGATNNCCSPDGIQAQDMQQLIEGGLKAAKVFFIKDMALTKSIFDNSYSAFSDYTTWGQGSLEIDGANKSYSSMVVGLAWDYFKNYTGVGQQFTKLQNTINKPLVNTLNNIIPYAGTVFGASVNASTDIFITNMISKYVDQAVQFIIEKVAEYFGIGAGGAAGAGGGAIAGGAGGSGGAAGGTAAGGAAGGGSAAGGAAGTGTATLANGAMAALGTCIMVIGIIYAIYSIGKMIAQMAVQCDEDEYKVASKIQQKLCDEVGNYCAEKFLGSCKNRRHVYCCFESQLARILNKQIRYASQGLHITYPEIPGTPLLAFSLTRDPKYADCSGITEEMLSKVDWTNVDLTEWLSLLKATGNISAENVSNGTFDALRNNYLPSGGYDSNGNKNTSQVTK